MNNAINDTKTWPELAIGLCDKLTGRGAEITYEFQDFEVAVPSSTAALVGLLTLIDDDIPHMAGAFSLQVRSYGVKGRIRRARHARDCTYATKNGGDSVTRSRAAGAVAVHATSRS